MDAVGAKIVTITMCAVMVYEIVGPVLTKWALTKAGEIDPANLRQSRRNKKKLALDVASGMYEPAATQDVNSSVVNAVDENKTPDTVVQTGNDENNDD